MIGQGELELRAATLGIALRHAELDYVMNHMLAQIAETPNDLVFRGGTALARVYWPDFRISEDLDFISAGPVPELERLLRSIAIRAGETAGMELALAFGRWRDDRSRSSVRWSTPWMTNGELLIDIVRFESASLPVEARQLHLPYSDLAETSATIPVMDVHEIVAGKWLMLDERQEPRDLFDLWWAALTLTHLQVRADLNLLEFRRWPAPASGNRRKRRSERSSAGSRGATRP